MKDCLSLLRAFPAQINVGNEASAQRDMDDGECWLSDVDLAGPVSKRWGGNK